jgi:cytochrome P450
MIDNAITKLSVFHTCAYAYLGINALLLALLLLYVLYRYYSYCTTPLNAMPGPELGFFLGMFPTLWENFMDPERRWFAEVSRKEGHQVDVIHSRHILGLDAVVLRDKDLVREIFTAPPGKNGGRFQKNIPALAVILGDGLVTLDGETWRRHRRIMEPSFNNTFLNKQLTAIVPPMVRQFIAVWKKAAEQKREIGVGSHISALTLDIIGKVGFNYDFGGIKCIEAWGDKNSFKDHPNNTNDDANLTELEDPLIQCICQLIKVDFWGRLAFALALPRELMTLASNVFPKYRIPRRKLDSAVRNIIAEAEKTGSSNENVNSILHLMLKAHDPESSQHKGRALSLEEINTEIKTFLMAGHETTGTWMSWAFYVLSKYPDSQEKVYQDIMMHVSSPDAEISLKDIENMNYFKAFFQEVLRLYPPAGQIFRKTSKTEIVNGVNIPTGTRMRIVIYLLHRNPKYWDNAEEFRPERWLNVSAAETERRRFAFIPFAGGFRNCIGQRMATMKVHLVMSHILREFIIMAAPSQRDVKFMLESLVVLRSVPDYKIVVKSRRQHDDSR